MPLSVAYIWKMDFILLVTEFTAFHLVITVRQTGGQTREHIPSAQVHKLLLRYIIDETLSA